MTAFLEPVVGWFTPPQRRVHDPWVFEPLDAARPAQFVLPSTIGSGGLDDFDGPGHVMGLYWNGSLVAVRLPQGRVVEIRRYHDRRWGWQPRAQAG